jgi:NADPH:quinone reductase-like Zn-dependent oxidoreductase
MKVALFEKTGPVQEVIHITEAPMPEPGPAEVRIKVSFANINPSDIMFIQGMYGIHPELPSSAGFEASGSIDAAGEGVQLPVGMPVIFSNAGVWQEYVVVPAKAIIPKPEGLSMEEAAQAFVNPMTAYGLLDVAGLKEGDALLLTAGASAFSKLTMQMAIQKGIRVIATVRRDDQVEMLEKLGAALVVNTEKAKLQKEVMNFTQGKGADAAFDAVGGTLGARVLASLKAGGTMHVYGLLSLENIPLNSGLMIFKNLSVKGFWLTTYLASLDKEGRNKAFGAVFQQLSTHTVSLDVEATYPLAEVKEALAHFERPGRAGKVLLAM